MATAGVAPSGLSYAGQPSSTVNEMYRAHGVQELGRNAPAVLLTGAALCQHSDTPEPLGLLTAKASCCCCTHRIVSLTEKVSRVTARM